MVSDSNAFKEKFVSKIQNSKNLVSEFLRNITEHDSLLYCPSAAIIKSFFSNIDKIYNENSDFGKILIVSSENQSINCIPKSYLGSSEDFLQKSSKKFFSFNENQLELLESIIYESNLEVENFSNKLCSSELNHSNCVSMLIFYSIESFADFESTVESFRKILRKIPIKTCFTLSPYYFYNYYKNSVNSYFQCFISKYYDNVKYFYKKLLSSSEIVNFLPCSDDDQALSILASLNSVSEQKTLEDFEVSVKEPPISSKSRKFFIGLLEKNLFDYHFVKNFFPCETKFISKKLIAFFNILKSRSGTLNYVYLSNPRDCATLYEIVKNRCDLQEISAHSNGNETGRFQISKGILKGTNIVVNAVFNHEVPSFFNVPKDLAIILYDFLALSNHFKRIFFVDRNLSENLKKCIFYEEKIESEICKISSSEIQCDKNYSKYTFTIFNKDIDQVKSVLDKKEFIHSIVSQGDEIYITASCTLGELFTAFNIYINLKCPVLLPKPNNLRIKPVLDVSKSNFFTFQTIYFGTLSTLSTFVNPRPISCLGFIHFSYPNIILYSFTNNGNIRIEFTAEDIDGNIILSPFFKDFLKNKGKDLVFNVNSEKSFLNIYFTFKRYPKIFFCKKENDIGRLIVNDLEIHEKILRFESFKWKRGSIQDFPFLSERFDIKISLNSISHKNSISNDDTYLDTKENIPDDLSIIKKQINASIFNEFEVSQAFLGKNNSSKPKNVSKRTESPVFQMIEKVMSSISNFPCRIIISLIKTMQPRLSFEQVKKAFANNSFEDYYSIISLLSRKGRLLVDKFTPEILVYLKSLNIQSFCRIFDESLKFRFEPVNFRLRIPNYNFQDLLMIRSVTITPLSIIYNHSTPSESNRILREFNPDFFLRVSIREENDKKFINDYSKNYDSVYEYFRYLMQSGLSIGLRRYFFLIMTNSQLRLHNVWFVTPYQINGVVIGADYIKNWLGDFQNIKNIGKYAVRVGQPLSSTIPTVNFSDFIEINDVERNNYCFTDGIGLISPTKALKISKQMGLSAVPSAFQIRFAGYKGVIAVHPFLEKTELLKEWALRSIQASNELIIVSTNDLIKDEIPALPENGSNENEKNNENDEVAILESSKPHRLSIFSKFDINSLGGIVFRRSMNKFSSNHRMMEVISFSKSTEYFLNRQVIQILEGLGISPQVFLNLQDKYIVSLLDHLISDTPSFVAKFAPYFPKNFISSDHFFFRKLIGPIFDKILEEINQKARIYIPEGRTAMGVADELCILDENEIFLMFPKPKDWNEKSQHFVDYGSYVVPSCISIISKNPCMHPGDIRTVKCVDKPELHYLKEVIVFSQKGDRPLFNKCSGSDLDGDMFMVCWNPLLIPKVSFKTYNYKSASALNKETVLLSDIVNFFIRYLKYNDLGVIANSLMVESDLNSIFSEKSLRLSELFNRSIDYIKTGSASSVSEDLLPEKYPDFMKKQPSYVSEKSLGLLYRRSMFKINCNYCECILCIKKEISQNNWQSFIMKGASPKVRFLDLENASPSENDRIIYEAFKNEIRGLLFKHNMKTEEELIVFEEASADLKEIFNKYKGYINSDNIESLAKLSNNCKESFNSLVWASGLIYKLKCKSFTMNDQREIENNFIFNSKIRLYEESIKNAKNESSIEVFEEFQQSFDSNNTENEMSIRIENVQSKADEEIVIIETPKEETNILSNFDVINEIDNLINTKITKRKEQIEKSVKIMKIELNEKEISKNIEDFYKNEFKSEFIFVKANIKNYIDFISKLDDKKTKLFKELFNLIILSELYKIEEIDRIIELFEIINSKMKSSNPVEFCKEIFPIADNSLFKLSVLAVLDFSITKKYQMLNNKDNKEKSNNFSSIKIHKKNDLIISGMLDENEDLEFFKVENHYIPVLKNKGICEIHYYKDSVRDFLANILFSHENKNFLKNEDLLISKKNQIIETSLIKISDTSSESIFKKSCCPNQLKLNHSISDSSIKDLIVEKSPFSGANEIMIDDIDNPVCSEFKSFEKPFSQSSNNNSLGKSIFEDVDFNEEIFKSKDSLKFTSENKKLCDDASLENSMLFNGDFSVNMKPIENVESISKKQDKVERIHFTLLFTPGQLIFPSIPSNFIGDKISIKNLSVLISTEKEIRSDKFKAQFLNEHRALNSETREEFLKSIDKLEKKGEYFELNLTFNKNRYALIFNNLILQKISKNKDCIGKSYLINNNPESRQINDIMIDLYREEIIYDDNINYLDSTETFLLTPSLYSIVENDIILSNSLSKCSSFKAKTSVSFQNEDGFVIEFVTSAESDCLNFKKSNGSLQCFAIKEWRGSDLNYEYFEKIFNKIWKNYANILIFR